DRVRISELAVEHTHAVVDLIAGQAHPATPYSFQIDASTDRAVLVCGVRGWPEQSKDTLRVACEAATAMVLDHIAADRRVVDDHAKRIRGDDVATHAGRTVECGAVLIRVVEAAEARGKTPEHQRSSALDLDVARHRQRRGRERRDECRARPDGQVPVD